MAKGSDDCILILSISKPGVVLLIISACFMVACLVFYNPTPPLELNVFI